MFRQKLPCSYRTHPLTLRNPTQIHLSDGQLTADQQRCRFWKANRIRQGSFYQPSSPSPSASKQANGMGSAASAATSLFGFAGEFLHQVTVKVAGDGRSRPFALNLDKWKSPTTAPTPPKKVQIAEQHRRSGSTKRS